MGERSSGSRLVGANQYWKHTGGEIFARAACTQLTLIEKMFRSNLSPSPWPRACVCGYEQRGEKDGLIHLFADGSRRLLKFIEAAPRAKKIEKYEGVIK